MSEWSMQMFLKKSSISVNFDFYFGNKYSEIHDQIL